MQPNVRQTELDGQLGIQPPSEGALFTVIGASSSGDVDTPAAFARVQDIQANCTSGPLVEFAAYQLERHGRPVLCVRATASVAGNAGAPVEAEDGTCSAVVRTGTGTAVGSIETGPLPDAAYSVKVRFAIGTDEVGAGGDGLAIYQISKDGGATYGFAVALGVAEDLAVTGIGTVQLNLTAGSIVAGDVYSFTTTAPIAASAGTLDLSGFTGGSVVTINGSSAPDDDYEGAIEFLDGGTIGVAGITYRTSLDNGRTFGGKLALGTATSITLGGVKVDFTAASVIAGDVVKFRTAAPSCTAGDLQSALDALADSIQPWEIAVIAAPVDATIAAAVDGKIGAMMVAGKQRSWIANWRMPNLGETPAEYLAAYQANMGQFATTKGGVAFGAAKIVSSVSGRNYRRPAVLAVAALQATVSEEINIAAIDVGLLEAVTIRDANGNPDPDFHDESVWPGGDDARAITLRTWDGVAQGVYTNRPLLASATGSDFDIFPKRRLMGLGKSITRAYLARRLNAGVRVNPKTGFIREEDAQEIEAAALSLLRAALLAKPKASEVFFTLSRKDNILATKTITTNLRIVPLGYPEIFDESDSFINPALRVVTA